MNIIPAFSAVDRLTPLRHLISFVLNFPSSSTLQGAKSDPSSFDATRGVLKHPAAKQWPTEL